MFVWKRGECLDTFPSGCPYFTCIVYQAFESLLPASAMIDRLISPT